MRHDDHEYHGDDRNDGGGEGLGCTPVVVVVVVAAVVVVGEGHEHLRAGGAGGAGGADGGWQTSRQSQVTSRGDRYPI